MQHMSPVENIAIRPGNITHKTFLNYGREQGGGGEAAREGGNSTQRQDLKPSPSPAFRSLQFRLSSIRSQNLS